jgi:hypothetical protein
MSSCYKDFQKKKIQTFKIYGKIKKKCKSKYLCQLYYTIDT